MKGEGLTNMLSSDTDYKSKSNAKKFKTHTSQLRRANSMYKWQKCQHAYCDKLTTESKSEYNPTYSNTHFSHFLANPIQPQDPRPQVAPNHVASFPSSHGATSSIANRIETQQTPHPQTLIWRQFSLPNHDPPALSLALAVSPAT